MIDGQKVYFPTKYLSYEGVFTLSMRYTHSTTHLTLVIIAQHRQITVIQGLKQTLVNKQ